MRKIWLLGKTTLGQLVIQKEKREERATYLFFKKLIVENFQKLEKNWILNPWKKNPTTSMLKHLLKDMLY